MIGGPVVRRSEARNGLRSFGLDTSLDATVDVVKEEIPFCIGIYPDGPGYALMLSTSATSLVHITLQFLPIHPWSPLVFLFA